MIDALARHREKLDKNPANELARFSLAKALFDQGEFAEAGTHFTLALVRKPDWMVAQILLGRCKLALGDVAAAKTDFEQARQLALEQNHEGPRAELDELLSQMK